MTTIFGMPADIFFLRIPIILFALTIHEFAHGYMALKLGDNTARNAGRLTLNPISHLDPIGAIMLMIGWFGWAKPVPVNIYNLIKPKRDILLVSLAGPLSNIALAICFGLFIRFFGVQMTGVMNGHFLTLLQLGFYINAGLAFFNLLPFPPLDGSKIMMGLIPDRHIPRYMHATRHILIIFIILIVIDNIIPETAGIFGKPLLSFILDPLFQPFVSLLELITGKVF